jgi:MYXO-CTERM domain-containing protein
MLFDVRLPIGLLFLAIGALVAVCGLTGDPKVFEAHSAGLNIDLAWGSVMAGFGVLMLGLVGFARRRRQTDPGAPQP